MAISMENPQDPSIKHESVYPIERKPSRTLLYIRHRAKVSNMGLVILTGLLAILSFHRLLSLYMTHRRWINAPITYLSRTCPLPDYETYASVRLMDDATAAAAHSNNNSNTSDTAAGALSAVVGDEQGKTSSSSSSSTVNEERRRLPKICMTTLTDARSTSPLQRLLRWRNFDGILELTWPNKVAYARKHNYQLYDGSASMDTSRPPAWSKIKAMQALLTPDNTDCDWVMWTDADTVIMNSHVPITDFLPVSDESHFVVASDNGGGTNSGVLVFRNSDWSRNFLDQWWNMKSYVRPPGFSLSGDNHALKALMKMDHTSTTSSSSSSSSSSLQQQQQEAILIPPRCTLNSFAKFLTLSESEGVLDSLQEQEWYMNENYYHKGDFIAHTPGYDNKQECLRLLLNEAQ